MVAVAHAGRPHQSLGASHTASACESARILLNSKSEHFPDGLANSSGQVGRNLMDSTGANIGADMPALKGRPIKPKPTAS